MSLSSGHTRDESPTRGELEAALREIVLAAQRGDQKRLAIALGEGARLVGIVESVAS